MKTKHTIIISIAVIAALAGAILPISSSFAQSSTAQKQNQAPDIPDQGTQTSTVDKNNAGNDGETNDDLNSASEGPNGDGDGEQKDSTESGK